MEPETNPEDPRQIYVKFAAPQLRDRNGKINAYYIKCTSVVSGKIISVVCYQVYICCIRGDNQCGMSNIKRTKRL